MGNTNHGPDANPEDGEIAIPKNVMELYIQLKSEGWEQLTESGDKSNTPKQGIGRKRQPAMTVEVSRLVLEKLSANGTKKVKVQVSLMNNEVHCTMYTDPYNHQLSKSIKIPEKDLHLLRQMIQDYWELINLAEKVEVISAQEGDKKPDAVRKETRESLKTTDVFVRRGDKLVRANES